MFILTLWSVDTKEPLPKADGALIHDRRLPGAVHIYSFNFPYNLSYYPHVHKRGNGDTEGYVM